MTDISAYVSRLTEKLRETFGERLVYVGLQGSYLRGEATQNSDIDVMALIDNLTAEDLTAYRQALQAAGEFEKSCGFVCGVEEMRRWNPLEICQLLHTTRDCLGELRRFVPEYTLEDERNYIKVSLGNLYHELAHRMIHASRERNMACLPESYKSAFFILQNMDYLRTGHFARTRRELLEKLEGEDQAVLRRSLSFSPGEAYDFDEAFRLLFTWCRHAMAWV